MSNPGAIQAGMGWGMIALLIAAGLIALVLIAKAVALALKKKTHPPNLPTVGETTFYQVLWRWRFDGKNKLEYLAAFCPECDSQIYARRAGAGAANTPGTVFRCESCAREICVPDIPPAQVTDAVERAVESQLKTPKRGRGRTLNHQS